MPAKTLKSAAEESHASLDAILKGDESGYQSLFSQREDVTLGNPFGPFARGRKSVEAALAGAASHYRDGGVTDVDLVATYASDNLASSSRTSAGRRRSAVRRTLCP
jgi:hypothetical protein